MNHKKFLIWKGKERLLELEKMVDLNHRNGGFQPIKEESYEGLRPLKHCLL